MKDEVAGELPVAFVVRSNGSKISEDDIKHFISQQVLVTLYLSFNLFIVLVIAKSNMLAFETFFLAISLRSRHDIQVIFL